MSQTPRIITATVDEDGTSHTLALPHDRPLGRFGDALRVGSRVIAREDVDAAWAEGRVVDPGSRIHTRPGGGANYVHVSVAVDEAEAEAEAE